MAGYDWDGLTNAAVNQLRLSRLRRMEPITDRGQRRKLGGLTKCAEGYYASLIIIKGMMV